MKKIQKPKCLAGTVEGEGGPSKTQKKNKTKQKQALTAFAGCFLKIFICSFV